MADQNVADGIVKARAAGYSDDEIASHLAETIPGIKQARDAGYSNSEIISHLAGNDASPASAPAAKDITDSTGSTPADVGKQLASGAVEGTADIATAIPRLAGAAKSAANKYLFDPVLNRLTGRTEAPQVNAPDINAAAAQAGDAVNNALPAPQTTAGKYARTVGTMLPNVVGGPEGLASRLLTRAVVPGVASEAAGQATEGTAAEPYARFGGAVLGGALASRLAAARSATPTQALPTVDDVQAAARAGYNSPEVQALRVNGGAVNNLGDNIAQSLENRGFFREDHAPVFNAVDRLSSAGPSVSFNELDAVRQALGNRAGEIDAFGRATPTSKAASTAKGMLDDFVNTDMTNPNNVLTGNPVAARATLQNARANSGAAIRADQVLNKLDNAQVDNAVTHSAMNEQNRIRQSLKTFVKNDGAKMAGYNSDEQAQMQRLVRGSMAMNALRYAGNAMGGSGMTVGPYVLFGHPAIPALGWALKKGANIATRRMTNNMADTLLQRAPVVQQVLRQNAAIRSANAAAARSATAQGMLRAAAVSSLASKTGRKEPDAP